MQKRESDGNTVLHHLLAVESAIGRTPPPLQEYYDIECPPAVEGIYFWWLDLHERRTNNGFSENPLSFQEILAWKTLYNIPLTDFQIDIILKIDRWWLLSKQEK